MKHSSLGVGLVFVLPLVALGSRPLAVGLGFVLLGLGARKLVGAWRALLPTTRCPAGHEVDQYGRFRCKACGAVSEGWVWRCAICGRESGWTPCPRCGLATPNPAR